MKYRKENRGSTGWLNSYLYSSFPCHIDGYIKSKVSGLHTS